MRSNRLGLSVLLVATSLVWAARAPVDRSWRSLGMGSAGVASVDDLDAVHLNPAGLALIGTKGTCKPLDTIGYPRDSYDIALLKLGVDPSLDNFWSLLHFWDRYHKTIDSAKQDPLKLVENQKLLDDLYRFDRKPLPVNVSLDAGAAFQNWGGAVWSQSEAALQLDHGSITPKASIDVTTTWAVEAATAQAFLDNRLSLGFGYRVVARSKESREYDVVELKSEGSSAPVKILRSTTSKLRKSSDWGHGFDLGALWFQTPALRLGGSFRDVGMKLDDQLVTPNLSLGAAWSPKVLQTNGTWSRRVNFGVALEDLLYDTLGYKPLSKFNFGFEASQTLVPKVLKMGISGGLKGGYPSFLVSTTLLRFLQLEFLTYAEETGYFTGDRESRIWMGRMGFGL